MTVMLIVVAPVLERHTYMMLDDSVECFPIRFIISSKTLTVAFKTLTARHNQEAHLPTLHLVPGAGQEAAWGPQHAELAGARTATSDLPAPPASPSASASPPSGSERAGLPASGSAFGNLPCLI